MIIEQQVVLGVLVIQFIQIQLQNLEHSPYGMPVLSKSCEIGVGIVQVKAADAVLFFAHHSALGAKEYSLSFLKRHMSQVSM